MKNSNQLLDKLSFQPGDHLCCLYETDGQHKALLTHFLRQGLERDEKVRYIADNHIEETILDYLSEDGFEVRPHLQSGQLGILRSDETYLRRGVFDPDEMINLLRAETIKALAQGYNALRVTGEMSWTLRGLPGSERLIEYEAKLNHFFDNHRCLAICQYDVRLFPPELLLGVLATHPVAAIGTQLYENFYYMSPADFVRGDSRARLDHWVRNLREHKRAEQKAKLAYEECMHILNTATDGIGLIDTDFNILRVNATFSTLVGIREDEAVGKKCFEIFESPSCHTPDCPLTRILSGDRLVEYEVERERNDGTRVLCLTKASPIHGPGGELVGIIADLKDITERKVMEQHIRFLPQKLLRAQENERERIGRYLHDQVAQDLSSAKIACETLFDNQPRISHELRQKVFDLAKLLQRSIEAVRNLAYDLRPPSLKQRGLVRTIFQHCQDFMAREGVKVDFYTAGLENLRLDSDTEINLYRLIQEALTNVKRHADASHVSLRLVASFPYIVLRIEDDGKGFDTKERLQQALDEKRLGLQSMQERVKLLGGKMSIHSRIMKGTKISIEIPYKENRHGSDQRHTDN
ncbi:MAG: MEDS domain-containing protein [Syntrophobacterales bacterium]|jgi:PAS domain S-box-containing protein